MKSENSQIAHEVIQKVAENPKVGMFVGGGVTASGWQFDANDFAVWLGIAVAAVSLYNQIMVAIRSRQKSKIKDTE